MFSVLISGISKAGLFITLEQILVDGLLPFHNLDDDYYVVQDDRLRAIGEQSGKIYTIGDSLQVCLAAVDLVRCHLDLCLPEGKHSKNDKKSFSGHKTGRLYRRRKMH